MDMLREYQLYQKAERLRVGSMWARTVQVENGKTVQNDLLFTSWDGTPFDLERFATIQSDFGHIWEQEAASSSLATPI